MPDRGLDSLALFACELGCCVGISRLIVLSLSEDCNLRTRAASIARKALLGFASAVNRAKYFSSEWSLKLTHSMNLNRPINWQRCKNDARITRCADDDDDVTCREVFKRRSNYKGPNEDSNKEIGATKKIDSFNVKEESICFAIAFFLFLFFF